MGFTNSSLVTYTNISPNRNSPRNQPISKITIHHMAGVFSVEEFGKIVANPSRQMSANYAIGNDGRIGLFCPEQDRSWCSSSSWNDNRAITIEVSNSKYGNVAGWPVSDAAYESLIKLCIDICKRNGIKKLTFTGDKNGSLTYHYMFSATACPGPWIKGKTQEICDRVNKALATEQPAPPKVEPQKPVAPTIHSTFKVGDLVRINAGAKYYNGVSIPTWVAQENWYISSISGDRAVLGLNEAKNRNIQSPINTKNISCVKAVQKSFTIKLDGTTPIYATAGGNMKGKVGKTGIYTIVEEKNVNGVTYGRLKSNVGWVITKGNVAIKKGDKVKVLNAVQYGNNKSFKLYASEYYVLEVNDNRVVISSDGKGVTAAVDKKNLQKV